MTQESLFNEDSGGHTPHKASVRNPSTPPPKPGKPKPDYGNLIGLFSDTCFEAHGHRPPRQIVTRLAKACGKLASERIDVGVMREAIKLMAERGNPPSTLPDVVFEVQAKSGPVAQEREAVKMFLEQHDGQWPTGAKFVRGTHAGNYVYDPLGYDRLPGGYDVGGSGIHRPSRQEVIDALKGA